MGPLLFYASVAFEFSSMGFIVETWHLPGSSLRLWLGTAILWKVSEGLTGFTKVIHVSMWWSLLLPFIIKLNTVHFKFIGSALEPQ
jgi:hypothetical protein